MATPKLKNSREERAAELTVINQPVGDGRIVVISPRGFHAANAERCDGACGDWRFAKKECKHILAARSH